MLKKTLIEKVLREALTTNADFAEVFIEDKFQTDATLLSGKIQGVNNSKEFGIGVRVET